MTDDQQQPLWERYPDESEAQYLAFTYYLNEPLPRTVDGAYRRYMRQERNKDVTDQTRASGTWRKWQKGETATGTRQTVPYSWQDRVAAYDQYISQQFTDEQIRMQSYEMKRELKATEKLLAKFNEMLEVFDIFMTSSTTTVDDDGKVIVTETVGLGVDGLYKLSKLHREISSQRRLAINLPDRVTETHIGNAQGKPFAVSDGNMYETYQRAKDKLKEKGFLMNDAPEMKKPDGGTSEG